jgi:hypothetical protein
MSALDTKGQSIRNAIISINKSQVTEGALDPATLIISKGGLPMLSVLSADYTSAPDIKVEWNVPTSPIITSKAKVIVVAALTDSTGGVVGEFPLADAEGVITLQHAEETNTVIYGYILDYRGSSKVASTSVVGR